MTDIADKAQAVEELLRDIALRNADRTPATPVNRSLRCWHCDAPLPTGRRWCGAVCRDAWEADRR